MSGVATWPSSADTLYALVRSGRSHGVPGTKRRLPGGRQPDDHQTADLSAFLLDIPTAITETEDFEPDGTWFNMIWLGGALMPWSRITASWTESRRTAPSRASFDISGLPRSHRPDRADPTGVFYLANLGVSPDEERHAQL